MAKKQKEANKKGAIDYKAQCEYLMSEYLKLTKAIQEGETSELKSQGEALLRLQKQNLMETIRKEIQADKKEIKKFDDFEKEISEFRKKQKEAKKYLEEIEALKPILVHMKRILRMTLKSGKSIVLFDIVKKGKESYLELISIILPSEPLDFDAGLRIGREIVKQFKKLPVKNKQTPKEEQLESLERQKRQLRTWEIEDELEETKEQIEEEKRKQAQKAKQIQKSN